MEKNEDFILLLEMKKYDEFKIDIASTQKNN